MSLPVDQRKLLEEVLSYPLFEAIMRRRARRFSKGADMPGEVTPYTSKHEPQPLDELEEALLVAVGTGLSGINLSDFFSDSKGDPRGGNTILYTTGRVFPSACASYGTELFFTNDSGMFMVKMRGRQPDKLNEFETLADWEKITTRFRESVVKISDQRLEIPQLPQVHIPFNYWSVNRPGSTLFMPITDVTWEYINLLMLRMDEPISNYIYDDLNGNAEPLKKFAEAGKLDKRRAMPLSAVERRFALTITGTEQAFMVQNMMLALQGLGLGGWIFSPANPTVVMGGTPLTKGLGFRFETSNKPGPLPVPDFATVPAYPVGLDGHFQGFCPPYHKAMNDAVQAVYDAKWGSDGMYVAGKPAIRNRELLANVPKTTDWCVDATKTLCTYIWETYGRFPAMMEPMQMNLWFQAHHLDTDFYDKYYPPGTYHDRIRDHQGKWHEPK